MPKEEVQSCMPYGGVAGALHEFGVGFGREAKMVKHCSGLSLFGINWFRNTLSFSLSRYSLLAHYATVRSALAHRYATLRCCTHLFSHATLSGSLPCFTLCSSFPVSPLNHKLQQKKKNLNFKVF